MRKLEEDRHFERPDIIRPPSEWQSYYLPLTAGCSNHSCTFCNYFHGSKLKIRDVEDVKKEIDALALYARQGLQVPGVPTVVYAIANHWDQRRIFLQDGDALVYPYPRLIEVLQHINNRFPDIERVGTYATPQDVLRRSVDQLRNLARLKLGIIYMGVESGDNEVLRKVGKGVDYAQIAEAGQKVKEAGITLSVTVILGLAGIDGSEKHALATARILSEIDPDYAGALTLTPVPGTPVYEQIRQGDLRPLSPFQSLEELKLIIENSSFSDCFFSSMHASNYFSIRGRLDREKQRVLGELEAIIRRRDPALLRPEFLRGL